MTSMNQGEPSISQHVNGLDGNQESEKFEPIIFSEHSVPTLSSDIVTSEFPLTDSVERAAQECGIEDPGKLQFLREAGLNISIVSTPITSATLPDLVVQNFAERVANQNRYAAEQGEHIEDTGGTVEALAVMGSTVVYITNNGTEVERSQDLAYGFMYPAYLDQAAATQSYPLGPQSISMQAATYFRNASIRADWPGLAKMLFRATGEEAPVELEDLYHLYDYAVGPDAAGLGLEGKGLGRLVYKYLTQQLPQDKFLVGFIDSTKAEDIDHRSSVIATLNSGACLVGSVPTSHDGDHPSLIVVYGHHYKPALSDQSVELVYQVERGQRVVLTQLCDEIERCLDNNPGKVIAFDREKNAYVLTALTPSQNISGRALNADTYDLGH